MKCFNCGFESDTEVHKRFFPGKVERMLCDRRDECFKRELEKIRREAGNQERRETTSKV